MPVSVPINSYNNDNSLLTSPQQSVSPRPPSHDMLDVQNGYQNVTSPSPGPGHSSPSPQSLKRGATSPDGHINLALNTRNNLRVVIPAGRESDNSLGGVNGGLSYGNSNHGQNFQSGDYGDIPLQNWNNTNLQNSHK